MGTNNIQIEICASVEEAPVYTKPEYEGVDIKRVVIVKNGTVKGNATVDIIFMNELGQKYIGMITANLLRSALALSEGDK